MSGKYYLESNIFRSSLRKYYKNMDIVEVVIREGDLESLKKLVSEGTDVEAENGYDFTPLILASANGHFEIVKYLIEKCEANVEAKNKDRNTPLCRASGFGHLEIVKYLIENGANYEELIERLEKRGDNEKRDQLEKIILEVADSRVKFITSDKY